MTIYDIKRDCKHCGAVGMVQYICLSFSTSGMYCLKCEKPE